MKRKVNILEKSKKIKKFIKTNKIKIKIKYSNIDSNFFTCNITFKEFKYATVNGKGSTRKQALLCAYAELFERLFSGALLGNTIMNKNLKSYDSYQSKKTSNLTSSCFPQINKYVSTCREYTKILSNVKYELPEGLINIYCQTNGIAAGNTLEESLAAGIYEIIERYVSKYYFTKEHSIYNIKITKKIMSTNEYLYLLKSNIDVTILDLTMNNRFPAIGVMLKEKNSDYFNFIVSVDYNLEYAFKKAIKDICQGKEKKICLKNKKKDIVDLKKNNKQETYYNIFLNRINNSGKIPSYLTVENKIISRSIFRKMDLDDKQTLNELSKIFENEIFYTIYNNKIFYVTRTYIKNYTMINELGKNELLFYSNFPRIKDIFYNLNNAEKSDIDILIKNLLLLFDDPKYKHIITINELFKYRLNNYISKMTVSNFLIYVSVVYENSCIDAIESRLSNYEKKIYDEIRKNKPKKINIVKCDISTDCNSCELKNKCCYEKGEKLWKMITK
ncbi:MAG: YcaO-like family protein [Cetobacterium sp.]